MKWGGEVGGGKWGVGSGGCEVGGEVRVKWGVKWG